MPNCFKPKLLEVNLFPWSAWKEGRENIFERLGTTFIPFGHGGQVGMATQVVMATKVGMSTQVASSNQLFTCFNVYLFTKVCLQIVRFRNLFQAIYAPFQDIPSIHAARRSQFGCLRARTSQRITVPKPLQINLLNVISQTVLQL